MTLQYICTNNFQWDFNKRIQYHYVITILICQYPIQSVWISKVFLCVVCCICNIDIGKYGIVIEVKCNAYLSHDRMQWAANNNGIWHTMIIWLPFCVRINSFFLYHDRFASKYKKNIFLVLFSNSSQDMSLDWEWTLVNFFLILHFLTWEFESNCFINFNWYRRVSNVLRQAECIMAFVMFIVSELGT